MLHSHRLFISPPLLHTNSSSSSPLLHRNFTITTRLRSSSQFTTTVSESEIGSVSEPMTLPESDSGPIELPPSSLPTTIFAVDENPSPLQVATSVLLTGAITVFLFRSLRRRARRAKELRVRSSGVKNTKDIKEEALESLKMMGVAPIEGPAGPPSPIQAALGSIGAAVITYILYRFTTTIEASLNRQTICDSLSLNGAIFSIILLTSVLHCFPGSSDNNYSKDYYKWNLLPCDICFWHQFYWFASLLHSACNKLLTG